jgi:hypothetical protein
VVTEPELCEEPLDVAPLDVDELSSSSEDEPLVVEASFEVELPAVVELLERDVLACCAAVAVAELAPMEPVAAMTPKASAKVATATTTTRRRIVRMRRARSRRRSRTRSEVEAGGGVEGMPAS